MAIPDLSAAVPSRLLRLGIPGDRVMQSFAQDPTTGQWYVSKVGSGNGGTDLRVYRLTPDGSTVLDWATLAGGGHGSTTALTTDPDTGAVRLLFWWRNNTTATVFDSRCVAWTYQGGADGLTVLRDDPSVETLPDLWGDKYVCFATDPAGDTVAVRVRDNTPTVPQGWIEKRVLAEYLAGTDNLLASTTPIDVNWTSVYQGHATTATDLWHFEGNDTLGYPLILRHYRWADPATQAGQMDVTSLGAGTIGGHNEAEGVAIGVDGSLLFGVVTGGRLERNADVYQVVPRTVEPGTARYKDLVLDVQNITGQPFDGAVVELSYDRTVRLTSGGLVPPIASEPVQIGDGAEAVSVLPSDDEYLTRDSLGFGIKVRVSWSDQRGQRRVETYVAQVLASDPDRVNLSAKVGAQVIGETYVSMQAIFEAAAAAGVRGASVESVTTDANSHLIFHLDDGTTIDAGPLAQGPEGPEGPRGPAGPAGPANDLNVGTVTTGAPGSQASATITGTPPSQTLDLSIPQGAKGEPGQGSDPTDANVAPIVSNAATDTYAAVQSAAHAALDSTIAGKVGKGELVLNARDFGIVGDGTTQDLTALNSQLSSTTGPVTVYFPPAPGIYQFGDPLVERDGVTLYADGLGTILRWRNSPMLAPTSTVSGWVLRYATVDIAGSSGHLIDLGATGGMSGSEFERVEFRSYVDNGSIVHMDGSGNFIGNNFVGCNMRRRASATVPCINISTTSSGVNSLGIDGGMWFSNGVTNSPMILIENTSGASYVNNMSFTNMVGEKSSGGLIHMNAANGILLKNCVDYDQTTYASSLFVFGQGGSNVSHAINIDNCGTSGAASFPAGSGHLRIDGRGSSHQVGRIFRGGRTGTIIVPDVGRTVINNGGPALSTRSVTGNRTLDSYDHVILASQTGTITLPDPTAKVNGGTLPVGREFIVKNVGTATTTVAAAGSAQIDGGGSVTLAAGEVRRVVTDGSDWWTL